MERVLSMSPEHSLILIWPKNDGRCVAEPTFSTVTAGQEEKLADEMMNTELEIFKSRRISRRWESTTRADE